MKITLENQKYYRYQYNSTCFAGGEFLRLPPGIPLAELKKEEITVEEFLRLPKFNQIIGRYYENGKTYNIVSVGSSNLIESD